MAVHGHVLLPLVFEKLDLFQSFHGLFTGQIVPAKSFLAGVVPDLEALTGLDDHVRLQCPSAYHR